MSNAASATDWSTSAHGGTTEPSFTEVYALKRQLDECGQAQDSLSGARSVAEAMSRTIARHFVTSVAIGLLLFFFGTLIAGM